jgi:hypothetical protein
MHFTFGEVFPIITAANELVTKALTGLLQAIGGALES